MKKFISMVMAAAMVVSLVPATAFAGDNYGATGTASFKVVNAQDIKKADANKTSTISGPQLQIKVKEVNGFTSTTASKNEFDVTLDFTGAELKEAVKTDKPLTSDVADITMKAAEKGDSTVELVIADKGTEIWERIMKDETIVIDLAELGLVLTRTSEGAVAKVEVSGDFGKSEALAFASVMGAGIKVTLGKVAEVAEEETNHLERAMEIKANIGTFVKGQRFEIKVNGGFELKGNSTNNADYSIENVNDDKVVVTVNAEGKDVIKINKTDLVIDAVSAKVGAVAKLTVKAVNVDRDGKAVTGAIKAAADAVEAAKVIGEEVLLKVDADEDVPVFYSGVNVANKGITDDADHVSLEVTLKESTKGALDMKKAFKLTLPEGVFVTDVNVTNNEGAILTGTAPASEAELEEAFAKAYKKGDQEAFEFARKTFVDTTTSGVTDDMDLKFEMTLVAVPGFTGDVTLKLEGDAIQKAKEVVIAKFVAPYTVEAQTNDLVIDYRNTAVPTDVVIKEAEAGLWAKGLAFDFAFDKSVIELEDDAKFAVNAESGMKLKDTKDMSFKVKEESDHVAATVTISDISLYMGRSIAAGAYHLKMGTSAGLDMMTTDRLFTAEPGATGKADQLGVTTINVKPYFVADAADWKVKDANVSGSFESKMATVKEGFVNVVTAGRDKDDASFTTKVVVPVGEAYIVAGENQIALDVPAYINAAGYTMLPVRAVATALGINNDNVIWSQAARQVTILYGQRIITMTVGESMVYVNGSAIPASAAVEITNGRAFLGLRDLANALGVTTIDWNNETKTATLN